jgi:hypothetical protein
MNIVFCSNLVTVVKAATAALLQQHRSCYIQYNFAAANQQRNLFCCVVHFLLQEQTLTAWQSVSTTTERCSPLLSMAQHRQW